MILLGINAGFGNADCGRLPLSRLDLDGGWVSFPRPKTGIERRCPLWPETMEALRAAMAERPDPKGEAGDDLVFVTKYGRPWSAGGTSGAVSHETAKLLRKLGQFRPGLGFYASPPHVPHGCRRDKRPERHPPHHGSHRRQHRRQLHTRHRGQPTPGRCPSTSGTGCSERPPMAARQGRWRMQLPTVATAAMFPSRRKATSVQHCGFTLLRWPAVPHDRGGESGKMKRAGPEQLGSSIPTNSRSRPGVRNASGSHVVRSTPAADSEPVHGPDAPA